MADLIFRHLAGADGEGVYKNGKTGFSVSYFKKKEIDSRYPSGGYMVVGQIGKGKPKRCMPQRKCLIQR